MKVLITGGDGFLGCQNAEYILENHEDSTVVLVDTLARAGGENARYLQQRFPGRVTLVKEDVRNFQGIIEHFPDVDRVYHMAAQVVMTRSLEDPMLDYQVNSTGTLNVLEAVRLKCPDATVIYCSTNKVYGDLLRVKVDENGNVTLKKLDPDSDIIVEGKRHVFKDETLQGITETGFHVGPESINCPYGSSKLAGELLMKNYAESYGIKTVRARMSCVYGPRQFGTEGQGWVAWFAIRTILGKDIVIYGNGMQVRDLLHSRDQARAFDLLASEPRCHGEAFNLGGGPGNALSLLQLLDMLEEITGKRSKIKHAGWRHGDQKIYISDISKIKEYTGFEPTISPMEGLKEMVQWIEENMDLIKKVEGNAITRDNSGTRRRLPG